MKSFRAHLFVSAAVVPLLLTGVVPATAATSTPLSLTFDTPSGSLGSSQTSFTNLGSALVTISVASIRNGQVTSRQSRTGQSDALMFPSFNSASTAPRAVIGVTSAGSPDSLSPGSVDFSWGADFAMNNGVTASKARGSHDNGDNLVQRGLFNETQFKLQLDQDKPTCRLRGSTGDAGAVAVTAPLTVSSAIWYGATCQRSGETLTITVVAYDGAGGIARTWTASRTSRVGFGDVTYAPSVPMSVGGKLDDSGRIVAASSDQFNGSVDNVFLTTSS